MQLLVFIRHDLDCPPIALLDISNNYKKVQEKSALKSTHKQPKTAVYGYFYGAGDRTRTGTPSLAVDFESTTSTISSHRQLYLQIITPKSSSEIGGQ